MNERFNYADAKEHAWPAHTLQLINPAANVLAKGPRKPIGRRVAPRGGPGASGGASIGQTVCAASAYEAGRPGSGSLARFGARHVCGGCVRRCNRCMHLYLPGANHAHACLALEKHHPFGNALAGSSAGVEISETLVTEYSLAGQEIASYAKHEGKHTLDLARGGGDTATWPQTDGLEIWSLPVLRDECVRQGLPVPARAADLGDSAAEEAERAALVAELRALEAAGRLGAFRAALAAVVRSAGDPADAEALKAAVVAAAS